MRGCTFGNRVSLCGAIGIAALAASLPDIARAQSASSPRADGGLDEIIVTARKREENLQSTPLSVAAFSSAALEERAVSNISDVGKFTPNLSFDSASPISGSSNSATIFIRGVGQTEFGLTIDPGVGIYLDGIYISRSQGALLDTADLASVEVLRGPQGTLFGKNTIGGALLLTSQPPGREFSAAAEVITGSYDRLDLRASVDAPLSEKVRTRLSVSVQNRDGYVTRILDGQTQGNKRSLSGRLVMVAEPTDDLEITLAADGTRAREQSVPLTLLSVNEASFFGVFHNQIKFGAVCGPSVPSRLSNPVCYNSQWISPTKYQNYNSGPNDSDLDIWGLSATIKLSAGGVDVKSITSYRSMKSSFLLENDLAPLNILSTGDDYDQEQFSQEIQVSGTAAGNRLDWVVGAYYQRESGNDHNLVSLSPASFLAGGSITNDSYAAFGQISYDLTPELSVTFGGRFTHEVKRYRPDTEFLSVDPLAQAANVDGTCNAFTFFCNPLTGRPIQVGEGRIKADEFTPSVTIDYRPDENTFVYVSYSKGFKSGGFTQRIFPPQAAIPSFAPEFVEVVEAGLKLQLFDRKLRWNTAIFQSDYSDLQVPVLTNFATVIRNAGKARIRGVESEFDAVPLSGLRINGGLGYLDGGYRSLELDVAGITRSSRLANTPEWSLTAGATLDLWTGAHGSVRTRWDWSFRSRVFKDTENTPEIGQGPMHLVNASITYETVDERWRFTTGVTNLTNRKYLVSGYSNFTGGGSIYGVYSRDRE